MDQIEQIVSGLMMPIKKKSMTLIIMGDIQKIAERC